ncbi:MAG TPA: AMP-binding protein [Gemmatimonadales bacterium]|nr:AMP-binding protein [Gemmatimonadales bacterium]
MNELEELFPIDIRTPSHVLARRAALHPDASFVGFIDRERRSIKSYTYNEFNDRVNSVANGLIAGGIQPGEKVMVMLPNSFEFVECFFALSRIGAVQVPTNFLYMAPQLQHVLSEAEPDALIVHESFVDRFAGLDQPSLRSRYIVGCPAEDPESYARLQSTRPSPVADLGTFNSTLSIMFTSGTTGRSKGVVVPHHQFVWGGFNWARIGGYTESDVNYMCTPMFHVAFYTFLGSSLVTGGSIVFTDWFSATHFWEEVRLAGATAFGYQGSIMQMLWKQPPLPHDRDNPVRVAIGAAAPPNIIRDFEQRFDLEIVEGFGMTENTIVTATLPGEERRLGSAGHALPGWQINVVNDNDEPVPPGEVGELVVRPLEPYVLATGYYRQPEATVQAWRNLWFHTGDAGALDADGYFYYSHRIKDAIRRRGENISALEVELAISEHPAVLECAVIAVPSELAEDDVKAVVVLRPNETVDPLDLLCFCEDRLPYYALPRYVEFRSALPKTPSQRVEKFRLREEHVSSNCWDSSAAGFVPKGHPSRQRASHTVQQAGGTRSAGHFEGGEQS